MLRSRRSVIISTALWIALCFVANLTLAQQIDEYTLRLSPQDVEVISAGLIDRPWKEVNPIIGKFQQQISKQQADAQAARDAKIVEDAKKKDDAK